ncbi:MAG: twin-arginine translocase subunit TatC [Elusimicrobia bacterium]|nr:twin-arginine translocase subunit TatC [Elusimicrobiota bacterium]
MNNEPLSLVGHLEELRQRLWIIIVAVVIFSAIAYHFSPQIIDRLAQGTGGLVFLKPAEAFLARLKIAFFLGLFLSLPVLLFEAWRFVALGLTDNERKLLRWIVPASYGLFVSGTALALGGVAPTAAKFLLGFGSAGLRPMITIGSYVEFLLFLAAAFGLLFQLPLVVLFLGKLGIVDAFKLTAYRKTVYLGIVAAAAVLTPGPDVFSQLLLAFPTLLLYEGSIFLVRWLCPAEKPAGVAAPGWENNHG